MTWEEIKFIPGTEKSNFGTSVSIDGNFMIVGAPSEDADPLRGYVQFYKLSSKKKWEKFGNKFSGYQTKDLYGWSVSISGNYAVVGARTYDISTTETRDGRIDIFKFSNNTWKIIDSKYGELAHDLFGYSVSISGNYILVGAPGDEVGALEGRGNKVYWYKKDENGNWNQMKLLQKDKEVDIGLFGWSVSINGNEAMVSRCGNLSVKGLVYWYRLNNSGDWVEIQREGKTENVSFGYSVSVNGNYSVIGETQEHATPEPTGAISFYKKEKGKWKRIEGVYGEENSSHFGSSVQIGGNYLFVGAYKFKMNHTGKAYFYKINKNGKLIPNGSILGDAGDDFLGKSVSINGNYGLVGASQYEFGSEPLINNGGYAKIFYNS